MKKLTFKYDLRNCPSVEELVKFRQGKLPRALDDDITHHLTFCKACSAKLTVLEPEVGEEMPEVVEMPQGFMDRVNRIAREALDRRAGRMAPAQATDAPVTAKPVEMAPPTTEEARPPEPTSAKVEVDLESLPAEKREMHKEAKRFARATVQNMISYKPSEVELGLQNKDLYERFRREIDRGRAMYEKRFREITDSPVDYFYEELVRLLAHNDPEALAGYPYRVPKARSS